MCIVVSYPVNPVLSPLPADEMYTTPSQWLHNMGTALPKQQQGTTIEGYT
jgi:hypothetical protein